MSTPADHAIRSDDLQEQAWEWLRTLHLEAVTPQDADRFRQWLASSQAHKDAFNAAKRRWAVLGPAAGEVLRNNREAEAFHERSARRPFLRRRAFLGAAASAAAVAGMAVAWSPEGLWPVPGEWGADERTATGEQKALTLAGHVVVTLNTRTRIRQQRAGADAAGIDLLAGEAAIDLPPGGRAFSVVAGAGRSMAESGRFEVRYLDGKVCVTCLEGVVRVAHPAGSRALQARQQTVYDGSSIGGVALIEPVKVSAWRKGELVFTQTPLATVVDEINRYRPGRVVLMNAAMRGKPVTGSFYIASLDLALSQLQLTFDLDARSLPGGLVVLS